jgi:hypothetical protein
MPGMADMLVRVVAHDQKLRRQGRIEPLLDLGLHLAQGSASIASC